MGSRRTHADKTSNETKTLGFEFQYWFFLLRVLQLKTGQSVGLEVADDVHTQLDNDYQILFQLKHTVQKKADGAPENLTTYDSDLWKTMWNWSEVISDKAAGRGTHDAQLRFVRKTEFVLVTNKSRSADTRINDLLSSPSSAKDALNCLLDGTESGSTKKHIEGVLSLDPSVLELFISKTTLDVEVDDLISKCKSAINEKQIAPERTSELLRNLDSQIRQDNFLTVKSGGEIEITFADFNRKYRAFFDHARSTRLHVRNDYDPLPLSLKSQIFIRQLLDIGDLDEEEIEQITKLTICKKTVDKNLLRWEIDGEITGIEIEEFDDDAIARWQNAFRELHRGETDTAEARALSVIDRLRGVELLIRDQHMGIQFSNGQFYKLADLLRIGFLPDWEKVYKEVLPI